MDDRWRRALLFELVRPIPGNASHTGYIGLSRPEKDESRAEGVPGLQSEVATLRASGRRSSAA